MKIEKAAIAGTLESSDAMVRVEPNDELVLEIESSVIDQYGEAIEETARGVLDRLGVSSGIVMINDQGALDCTIKARIETAVLRANDVTENIDWGGMIQ